MKVQKFAVQDAKFERSPGQDAEVFAANVIDQRHGGPITIGFGRSGAHATLEDSIAVHDVMIVIEGSLSVTSDAGTVTAAPSEIVYLPKGEKVKIEAHAQGAVTAYVTHPHWQEGAE